MIEDQLSHDERLRLEVLAQANSTSHGESAEVVIHKAQRFEKYVREGES